MIKIFATSIVLMVTVVIIAGLYLAGSPMTERERRFDNQRVNELMQIASAIDQHADKTGKLPTSLHELTKPEVARLYSVRSTADPETSAPYKYEVNGANSYTLCATFRQASITQQSQYAPDKFWEHPAGEKCFKLISQIKAADKK